MSSKLFQCRIRLHFAQQKQTARLYGVHVHSILYTNKHESKLSSIFTGERQRKDCSLVFRSSCCSPYDQPLILHCIQFVLVYNFFPLCFSLYKKIVVYIVRTFLGTWVRQNIACKKSVVGGGSRPSEEPPEEFQALKVWSN